MQYIMKIALLTIFYSSGATALGAQAVHLQGLSFWTANLKADI